MLIALVLASVIVPNLLNRETGTAIEYSSLIDEVTDGRIDSVVVTNQTGAIKAEAIDGTTYTSKGPIELPETDLKLLRDRNLAVYEVAFLLGYSEPSTFYRAFRRWEATSPHEYRRSIA